jgi:hypothetical protein
MSMTSTLSFWQVAPHNLFLRTKDCLVHVEQEVPLICRLELTANSAHSYVVIKAEVLILTMKFIHTEKENAYSTCRVANLESLLSCLIYYVYKILLDSWFLFSSCSVAFIKKSHCSHMSIAKCLETGWMVAARIPVLAGFLFAVKSKPALGPRRQYI